MSSPESQSVADTLVQWQKVAGRQHLPWQNTGDAYRVWLSEVMLQQTQVTTVLGYYDRFLKAFPTVTELAQASEEEVMQLWAGLGYYSRARNLHACARQVLARFGGEFPRDVDALESLPGIGRSTAGAIASLSWGLAAPILDGNVKRVYCRLFGVEGYPEQTAVKRELWAIAERELSQQAPGVYNQALMDLGATVCTPKNPNCAKCPLMKRCVALKKGMVGQLPQPKPKKPRPSQYFVALAVRSKHGEVGLTARQGKGVWRGLWMWPHLSLEGVDQVVDWPELAPLLQEIGLQADERQQAELVRQLKALNRQDWLVHELTHRKMHFKVLALDGVSGGDLVAWSDRAVPRLVHKIMEQLGWT
ncbi:MAG TPA: A/G-specific adenine glycosylase [Limnobacter sp.]|uniref:A/G-specific adenine glycosylase n=1 Tax=Limnobacter sp. TaxID=2003368 RepID=UPI002E347B4B|nr:A/G-specific adenine glycosylase [Limnobacter sp.]HEX5485922.1 A/G-specific adenine glycosylase [Limnobacter sp.]